jgi:hypothetical protein
MQELKTYASLGPIRSALENSERSYNTYMAAYEEPHAASLPRPLEIAVQVKAAEEHAVYREPLW